MTTPIVTEDGVRLPWPEGPDYRSGRQLYGETSNGDEVGVIEFGYDPNQPRVPAGSSAGGQWTDSGGGASDRTLGATNAERPGSRAALAGTNEPLPFLDPAPLDLDEVRAIETYMGVGALVNGQLRRGAVGEYNQTTVEQLDEAFDQSPGVSEDTVVYRLIPTEMTQHPNGPGWGDPDPVEDAGYMSTTYNRQQMAAIARTLGYERTHTEIKIIVPKGTKALHISDGRFQNELLLPRGGRIVPTGPDEWRFER
jgi:hypothetical protein